MDLPLDVAGIDMNDNVNLSFYTQFIRFQSNFFETENLFFSPDNPQQRMIQSWAHEVSFAFEYTLATQTARVIKSSLPQTLTTFGADNSNFLGFDSITDIGFDNAWPDDLVSEALNRMNSSQTQDDGHVQSTNQHRLSDNNLLYDSEQFGTIPEKADSASNREGNEPGVPTSTGKLKITHHSRTSCCSYAYDLEHTIIAALSALDREITGAREDCCAITGQIMAGKLNDIEDVVRQYISNTKIGKEAPSQLAPCASLNESNNMISSPSKDCRDSASSVGSISSTKNDRGRKRIRDMFSRRPSLQSPASSTFQEYVFDSRTPRTASPASGASGRRGPLDATTNAAAKAVKAMKACWRCRFLRKTCSVDKPCLACPKPPKIPKGVGWPSVPCRRGTFAEEMLPLCICLQALNLESETDRENEEAIDMANEWLRLHIQSRESVSACRFRVQSRCSSPETNPTSEDCPPKRNLDILSSSQEMLALKATISPLDECIDSILQEITDTPSSRKTFWFGGESTWIYPMPLLRAAAKYQARTDNDQLIAQSLICLRSSLEALACDEHFRNRSFSHNACTESFCRLDWITKINTDLELYSTELSRVFFKKENMRAKENWWLSTFYSFCIQSIVRRALLSLPRLPETDPAVYQYLHLAVRLFAASSGSYDPLLRDYAVPDLAKNEESSNVSSFQAAQSAIQQSLWAEKGIKTSAEFLKIIFEDEGGELKSRDAILLQPEETIDNSQIVSPSLSGAVSPIPIARDLPEFGHVPSFQPAPYRASSLSSVESVDDFLAQTTHTPATQTFNEKNQSRRKAQNRAAQRAFRERRERHIKELENRIKSLESEVEKLAGMLNRCAEERDRFKGMVSKFDDRAKSF